jgi:hypothetical protein
LEKGGIKLDSENRVSVLAGIRIEAGDDKSERTEAMGGWKVIGLLITDKR